MMSNQIMFVISNIRTVTMPACLHSFLLPTRCSVTAVIACEHGVGYHMEIGKKKYGSDMGFCRTVLATELVEVRKNLGCR